MQTMLLFVLAIVVILILAALALIGEHIRQLTGAMTRLVEIELPVVSAGLGEVATALSNPPDPVTTDQPASPLGQPNRRSNGGRR